MPKLKTRSDLIDYCLRKLGAPVLEINVAPEQVEDRISDALDFFNEFHEESTARIFHKHQVTEEDHARQWILVPEDITHIHKVLPLSGVGNIDSIFDPNYQMHLSEFSASGGLTSGTLQYYWQWNSNLQLTEMLLNGTRQEFDFTRYKNELKIRVDWEVDIAPGQWLIIDAERLLVDEDDPDQVSNLYNDQFLKEYATALIKEQWGENLSKFEGMTMPGGVTFSGERIRNEARDDIRRIREEARLTWETPLGEVYMG